MSVAHHIPCFSLLNIHWVVLDTFKLSCSTCVVCYSDIADWRHDAVLSCIFMTIVPHNKTAMTGFSLFLFCIYLCKNTLKLVRKKDPRVQKVKKAFTKDHVNNYFKFPHFICTTNFVFYLYNYFAATIVWS